MLKLDSTFNSTGIATFGTKQKDNCQTSIIQPDGKILMCGWTLDGDTIGNILIVRAMSDGTIDSTFGDGGKVQANYNGNGEKAFALALQEDGRIVIAGQEYLYPHHKYDFVLLRLLSDGTPDSTFGNAGWVITDLGSENEFITSLAVQADGKIIAAGRIEITTGPGAGNADFAMVRYLQDGTLDTQFGISGLVQTTFFNSPNTFDEAHAIAILPSGNILLGGFTNHTVLALSRYNSNGSLDSTFGEYGLVTTDVGKGRSGYINTIRLLQDGRFLVGGPLADRIHPWESDMGMARYMPNGDLDLEFGHNGLAIRSIGTNSRNYDFVPLPDGRILICGVSNVIWETQYDWLIARLLEDGELDPTFGTNGYITMPMGGPVANKLWIQPDSSIVVTGGFAIPFDDDYDFAAARFITDKTSSVADHPSENNLSIKPNPSNGTFSINLDPGMSSDLHIDIYDLYGRSVYSSLMYANTSARMNFTVPGISDGCYLLQICNGKSRWVRKLLIQK